MKNFKVDEQRGSFLRALHVKLSPTEHVHDPIVEAMRVHRQKTICGYVLIGGTTGIIIGAIIGIGSWYMLGAYIAGTLLTVGFFMGLRILQSR